MKEKELRDEFAMAALGPMVERFLKTTITKLEEGESLHGGVLEELKASAANAAYQIADACMKEREKQP